MSSTISPITEIQEQRATSVETPSGIEPRVSAHWDHSPTSNQDYTTLLRLLFARDLDPMAMNDGRQRAGLVGEVIG